MPSAEATRRSILFAAAAVLLLAALMYIGGGTATVPDTLPTKISDQEFWRMITDFSEAGGYFRSDNLLSNEAGFQAVIPLLRKTVRSGGIYMGVGPEQNFTYIVGLQPKLAFIVDIRRLNMLQHLLYKALMELSADRAEFLSRLFSRPRPPSLGADASAVQLVRAYQAAQPNAELFAANLEMVIDYLERTKGFGLTTGDEDDIRQVSQAFWDSGPELSYSFHGGYGRFRGMPTYGELMTEDDGHSHNWHFLANEEQYQIVQRLQKNNLIIPLVGDFAGPKAIQSVAQYLKQHAAVLSVFYTSNVEQYLFQDDENWRSFYANAAALPLDSSSTFVRYVLNSWRFPRRSRSLVSPIMDVLTAYDRGRIRSYYDVIGMSW